jgi:hypothetical protein
MFCFHFAIGALITSLLSIVFSRKESELDSEQVREFLLTQYGLRVEPEMGKYLAELLANANEPLAVIGGDARTGAAVRRMVAPGDILGDSLQQGSA